MHQCLSCSGNLSEFKKSVFDTRFGFQGLLDIYKCNSCNLVQLNPYYLIFEIKRLYETFYNYGGNQKGSYVKLRKAFVGSILYSIWMALDGDICFHSKRGTGRLLDIGCNEGQGLQIYKNNGFVAEGLEFNEKAASEARKNGFRVFSEPLERFYPESLYDVVILSHVLEHSKNPKEMLSHVARLLKPGGQVWISCPNIISWQKDIFRRYWINWHVPFHFSFFSPDTLKTLLNDSGFQVLKIKNATPSLWVAQSIIAALFAKNGRKNLAHRSAILLGTLIILIRFFFFPILLFSNLLNRGDCLIMEGLKKTSQLL